MTAPKFEWTNPEVYKRLVLWIALMVSLVFNYVGYSDWKFMDEQFRMVKQGLAEDVLQAYDWECSNK